MIQFAFFINNKSEEVCRDIIIGIANAESLLEKISDKWEWDRNGSSAHSSSNAHKATFIDDRIQFISIWIEELE